MSFNATAVLQDLCPCSAIYPNLHNNSSSTQWLHCIHACLLNNSWKGASRFRHRDDTAHTAVTYCGTGPLLRSIHPSRHVLNIDEVEEAERRIVEWRGTPEASEEGAVCPVAEVCLSLCLSACLVCLRSQKIYIYSCFYTRWRRCLCCVHLLRARYTFYRMKVGYPIYPHANVFLFGGSVTPAVLFFVLIIFQRK